MDPHEASKENVREEKPFVPGTIHLVDLEGTMRAKHASGHQDIVLVPAPSADPDDPLNWTPRRKLLSTSCMCMYTLMVGWKYSVTPFFLLSCADGDLGRNCVGCNLFGARPNQ